MLNTSVLSLVHPPPTHTRDKTAVLITKKNPLKNNYFLDKKKVKLFFTVFFRLLKRSVLSQVRVEGWEHEFLAQEQKNS
jgi:hypothetical protein